MLEIMVKLEEEGAETAPIARVNSVASAESLETPSREVVTLYGTPTAESLALAVAASLEAQKVQRRPDALRDLTISSEAGAVGDAAWRDASTGEMIRADLAIPLTVLKETASELLMEGGRRSVARSRGSSRSIGPKGRAAPCASSSPSRVRAAAPMPSARCARPTAPTTRSELGSDLVVDDPRSLDPIGRDVDLEIREEGRRLAL